MSNKIHNKKLGPKILSEYRHGEETKTVERATRLCCFFLLARVRCDAADTVIWIRKVRNKRQTRSRLPAETKYLGKGNR